MLKNYFKSALRNMARRKGYSFINITGLAIGMACCLLIFMFVNDELNCDNYNENADRIYRVAGSYRYGGRDFQFGTVSAPMAAALINEFPEVEDAVRFRNKGSYIIKFEDKSFTERRVIFSDTTIFNVFTIPLRQGDPKTALKEPYTIVLSKKNRGEILRDRKPPGQNYKT